MSFKAQQGLGLGLQGAQLGGQVGGAWGAVIGGAIGLFTGLTASDNEKKMMQRYNDEVVKNAASDLFEMRRQLNEENIRTSMALAQYQAQRKVATGTVNAQIGAAELLGSSAEAFKQTYDFQTQEAMNQTILNAQVGYENYNTMIDQMTNQREGQLQRYRNQPQQNNVGSLLQAGFGAYGAVKQAGGLQQVGGTMIDQFKSIWNGNGLGNLKATLNSAVTE